MTIQWCWKECVLCSIRYALWNDAVSRPIHMRKWNNERCFTGYSNYGYQYAGDQWRKITLKIRKDFPKVKVIAMRTFKERSYISHMIQTKAILIFT